MQNVKFKYQSIKWKKLHKTKPTFNVYIFCTIGWIIFALNCLVCEKQQFI